MTPQDLKPHECAALSAIITRHSRFYYRLAKRAERLGWPVADPVYRHIIHARNAVDALRVFVDDIGKNRPNPPTTPGAAWYLDNPNVAPGRRRAR